MIIYFLFIHLRWGDRPWNNHIPLTELTSDGIYQYIHKMNKLDDNMQYSKTYQEKLKYGIIVVSLVIK